MKSREKRTKAMSERFFWWSFVSIKGWFELWDVGTIEKQTNDKPSGSRLINHTQDDWEIWITFTWWRTSDTQILRNWIQTVRQIKHWALGKFIILKRKFINFGFNSILITQSLPIPHSKIIPAVQDSPCKPRISLFLSPSLCTMYGGNSEIVFWELEPTLQIQQFRDTI